MTRKSLISRGLLATAIGIGFCGVLPVTSVSAQTLEQALAQAYQTNPTIAAQRARQRAVDESVPQALAGYRPTARLTGQISRSDTKTRYNVGADGKTNGTPKALGVTLSQPLFDATVTPSVRRAENLVQAQRATLLATEETVLLSAATAYLDVVKNQAVVELNKNNEQVLKRQLDASQDRFRVGEYTRTDVALSQSSLAAATASRVQAEGQLAASMATYERYIGSKPGNLKSPKPKMALPKTLDEVVSLAQANNPNILAASFNEAAQREAVDQAFGSMLPSANVSVQASRTWDPARTKGYAQWAESSDSLAITGQVVVPIYQAGLPEARVREAKQTANQYRIQITDARTQITESAISAWQSLETARANVVSYKAQIDAARIALDGVRQEAQVGSRTVLDVLNSEQSLLSARVNLVSAERNEQVAAFTVLSAIGQLTAQQLGLKVEYYDPSTNYENTRGKWLGTGIAE